MQSTRFNERKARVLEARVVGLQRRNRPAARRFTGIAFALCATLACFFALKGATLAYFGDDGFLRMTATANQANDANALRFWLTGIDPVTRFVADVLSTSKAGA